jgi:outer membrane protein TolC
MEPMIREGKLLLSLDDAIALALESNSDIMIQRYTLPIADTDILSARAGGSVDPYDPVLTSSLGLQYASIPQASVLSTGSQQNTGTADFTYKQAFPTGTLFTLDFNNNRVASNNPYSFLNPTLNSNLSFSFRQHLLQGLGISNNQRLLIKARNNREIADVDFRLQVITTVTDVEKQYWDLVNAYENAKSKQQALELARQLLEDNRKKLDNGAVAPIELVRAESQVASDTRALIVAQTDLRSKQLHLKNLLSCDLSDTRLSAAEVVPTDAMQIPPVEHVEPVQDLIETALSHRTDLKKKLIDLANKEVDNKANANALLPTVDLTASYGMYAVAGAVSPSSSAACLIFLPASQCGSMGQSTGYSNALSTLWGDKYPTYGLTLNVTLPLRNRSALAAQRRSELELRMAQAQVLQLENTIRVDVRDAQDALQQNRTAVEAAQKARQLYYETMRAEQLKYGEGASTTYNVMQTQRDLAGAEADLLNAMSAYQESRVEMDRVTGMTLVNLGIDVADAESGDVKHLPKVPNVVPASSLRGDPEPAPGAQAAGN